MTDRDIRDPAMSTPGTAGGAASLGVGRATETAPKRPEDTCKTAAAVVPEDKREIGGPKGPEPTRYGDWERKGRCIDF